MHKVVDTGHEAVIQVGIMGPLRALPTDPGLRGTRLPQPHAPWPLVAHNLTLGRGNKAVLRNLSVTWNRGEIIGVAGPSGSGKSTLLQCALGLIPDYDGSLHLLGVEARDANKAALSRALLYAQQEPFVLTGTVRDNLLATTANHNDNHNHKTTRYTDDDLRRALRRACLTDDTDWALDAPVHEGGRNLSGGQRQRLALARIFLSIGDTDTDTRQYDNDDDEPKEDLAQLVVLDEATSALDNVTEASVIDEIEACARKGNKTVVMVAHRLSTLRRADRILVMDEGSIVQDGSYTDLENQAGPFRDLLEARAGAGVEPTSSP